MFERVTAVEIYLFTFSERPYDYWSYYYRNGDNRNFSTKNQNRVTCNDDVLVTCAKRTRRAAVTTIIYAHVLFGHVVPKSYIETDLASGRSHARASSVRPTAFIEAYLAETPGAQNAYYFSNGTVTDGAGKTPGSVLRVP